MLLGHLTRWIILVVVNGHFGGSGNFSKFLNTLRKVLSFVHVHKAEVDWDLHFQGTFLHETC